MGSRIRIEVNKSDVEVMVPQRFEIMFPVGIRAKDLYGVSIARKIYDVDELCEIITNDPSLRKDLRDIFMDICHGNLVRLIVDMAREAIMPRNGC